MGTGRRRQTLSPADGSTESRQAKRRKLKLRPKLEDLKEYTVPSLTEDILCRIHSLLPLRDAAQAACVSHALCWSWRHFPNLIFSKDSPGLSRKAGPKEKISSEFTKTVDHILKNHSGTGVRTLELCLAHCSEEDHRSLDRWLQMGIMPGIEKVRLSLSWKHGAYRFPGSHLSDGKLVSIRHLQLSNCAFCPSPGSWFSRNLVILNLRNVRVMDDGLWCLLSSSSAMQRLSLKYCSGIICLKIPGSLKRLGYLKVAGCNDLRSVESKSPNLSTFSFEGNLRRTHISLGEALRVKELHMDCSSYALNTGAKLESIMLDAETIDMHPSKETTEISSKSAHLERLYITVFGSTPFYLSVKHSALVCLFGASHSVEDFVSHVSSQLTDHVSFCSALWGRKTSARSAREERMVEGACCMLKAWLS